MAYFWQGPLTLDILNNGAYFFVLTIRSCLPVQVSESVIFELSGVENGGVGPKTIFLTLIDPDMLISDQFGQILEPIHLILGHSFTLGIWTCHFWAQWCWKWGCRTKNHDPSPDKSRDIDLCQILANFDEFWTPHTQFWDTWSF